MLQDRHVTSQSSSQKTEMSVHVLKDVCVGGKTAMLQPRDRAPLQPRAALTLGESSSPCPEEVNPPEIPQTALEVMGAQRTVW